MCGCGVAAFRELEERQGCTGGDLVSKFFTFANYHKKDISLGLPN